MIKLIGNLLLLTPILLFACQSGTKNSSKSERQKLYDEVMAIHDEMMPKIKPIRDAQKKIMATLKDTTQNLSELQKKAFQMAYSSLENADQQMNNWMKQFKNPNEDTDDETAIHYLKDQKKKVQQMKQFMEDNINAAKKTIDF